MPTKQIALVRGDGAAPEMMEQAVRVVDKAARLDDLTIDWVDTPMGWNAYEEYGDTTPEEVMRKALDIGTIFFGGVGDHEYDQTVGKKYPDLMPERRALLRIREELGLLLNFRPMILTPELAHLSPLKANRIPAEGVKMVFIRFLLQDSYFGTKDLVGTLSQSTIEKLGLKLKHQVDGKEPQVAELSYYIADTVRRYLRAAFEYAWEQGLPLISIDKANVSARYTLWRNIAEEVAKEFPDVEHLDQYVDSANALMINDPKQLHGVIACGNEHGDILSDGAAAVVGGMGLMHSSAIDPINGRAMFESGAGTAPALKGKNEANPLGRILTGALMLRHLGAGKAATAIESAVKQVLHDGYRTPDIAGSGGGERELSTSDMGDAILANIAEPAVV